MKEAAIIEKRRLASPAITPQALAYSDGALWMGSRDVRRVYKIDIETWTVLQEIDAPGIPWAGLQQTGRFASRSVKARR